MVLATVEFKGTSKITAVWVLHKLTSVVPAKGRGKNPWNPIPPHIEGLLRCATNDGTSYWGPVEVEISDENWAKLIAEQFEHKVGLHVLSSGGELKYSVTAKQSTKETDEWQQYR